MVTSCAMTRHPPPCANRWSRLQAAPVSAEAPGTIDAIRPDAAPTALSHSASAQTGLTAHVVVRAIANVADTAISNKSVRRPSDDQGAIADDDRMLCCAGTPINNGHTRTTHLLQVTYGRCAAALRPGARVPEMLVDVNEQSKYAMILHEQQTIAAKDHASSSGQRRLSYHRSYCHWSLRRVGALSDSRQRERA
jgi:hypothetical protein